MIIQIMRNNKNQSGLSTPSIRNRNHYSQKYSHQRLKTNTSFDINRTQKTQSSISSPYLYGNLFSFPKYSSQYQSADQKSREEISKLSLIEESCVNNQVSEEQAVNVIEQLKMIQFHARRNMELKHYVEKKQEHIDKMKVERQEKEHRILKHKKDYERQSKQFLKKKVDMHKYKKMINQMHIDESLWWKVAFKKLQKKMDHRRYVNQSFVSQYSEMSRNIHSRRGRNKPYQVNVPIVMPPHHCCTDRISKYYYDNARLRTQDDFLDSQQTFKNNNDGEYLQFRSSKRRTPRSKRSESRTRTKTQYAEDIISRRPSKKYSNQVKYIQDTQTERQHEMKRREDETNVKKKSSTVELIRSRQDKYYNAEIIRNDKQMPQIKLDYKNGFKRIEENISPIKQTQSMSEYVSQEEKKRKNLIKEQEELQLADLIQKSVMKKGGRQYVEEKKKSVGKSSSDDSFPCQLMEKTQHNNNNFKGLRHQKEKSSGNSSNSRVSVHLDTPELGRKKSEESRSSSDAGRLLSVKIPRGMMESKVDIDMSDMMEESRISRRERANSLQNERSKIMGTIAKQVILIEEESEQGSMKTTQNNDRSQLMKTIPPDCSDIGLSRHVSSHPRSEPREEKPAPLPRPPHLEQLQNKNEGLLSSIELKSISRNSRDTLSFQRESKPPFDMSRENSDDFLAGINLVKQSKISRSKDVSFQSSPKSKDESRLSPNSLENSKGYLSINTNSQKKPFQERQSGSFDFDIEFDLSAESKVIKRGGQKSKINIPKPSKGKVDMNRSSYGSELTKELSALPIVEDNQEQQNSMVQNIRGRRTIK